jgi:hypothetical protein
MAESILAPDGTSVRSAPGFPGYYVSDCGVVWSGWRRGGSVPRKLLDYPHRIRKPQRAGKGYLRVDLHLDGISVGVYVHRLVLVTFVGPCPDGMECCHTNGIRTDNRLENLRWDTPSENNYDLSRHHGGHPWCRGSCHPKSKLTETDVYEIWRLVRSGMSHRAIAERFGVVPQTISCITAGKSWRYLSKETQVAAVSANQGRAVVTE